MELEMNFSNIQDLDTMHLYLKEKFGFPDFCGKNGNAYIDCLSSLRYPEDEMTGFTLAPKEVLNINIKLFKTNSKLHKNFVEIVKAVNERYQSTGQTPPIILTFT